LTFDGHGNLFGMTTGGVGSAFKLTKATAGQWRYRSLFCFCNAGAVGESPQGKVILDSSGRLYGATYTGGTNGAGVVFRLTQTSAGWSETVLYGFTGGTDGGNPGAGLARDSTGRLYGTTQFGGTGSHGVAFRLTHTSTGWIDKVLHSFPTGTVDGTVPLASMILDSAGNLYGTTYSGTASSGTVFEITP
jgi:hypothetical protein